MGKITQPIEYVPKNSYLKFIKETEPKFSKKVKFRMGIYQCICGKEVKVAINNAKTGKQRSCGCLRGKMSVESKNSHGLAKHPLFRIWVDMKNRCENKNATNYFRYGGAGIFICDEWRKDFINFYNWAINNGWKKGLRLDKDKIPYELGIVNKSYCPEYCCFITHKENCNYRKSNKLITFNGVTKTMGQWSEQLGFNEDVLYNRFKYKWSIERALTTPVRISGKNKHLYGNV